MALLPYSQELSDACRYMFSILLNEHLPCGCSEWILYHCVFKWHRFSIPHSRVNVPVFIFWLTNPGNHRISSQHCPLLFCCGSPKHKTQIKQRLITIKPGINIMLLCLRPLLPHPFFPRRRNYTQYIMTGITLYHVMCGWDLVLRLTAPLKMWKKGTRMVKLTDSKEMSLQSPCYCN